MDTIINQGKVTSLCNEECKVQMNLLTCKFVGLFSTQQQNGILFYLEAGIDLRTHETKEELIPRD